MLNILKQINEQIKELKLNKETIEALNNFFKELNEFLKGDNTTLICIKSTPREFLVISNILSDNKELLRTSEFKLLFIEFLKDFSDNKELLYDIFIMLLEFNIIELNDALRLVLFKELYLSGYFCYVALNSVDFKNNYEYIEWDLKVIANIVSEANITDISEALSVTLNELYLFDNIELKDILI